MIPRYTRKEMSDIWSDESTFKYRLRVESCIANAQAKLGIIPKEAAKIISEQSKLVNYDADKIDAIEKTTHHDIIALLQYFSTYLGDSAPYLHFGITSSDLIDTSLSCQLKQACELIEKGLLDVLESLKRRINEHKYDICIGRSHGMHAEPTTFGLKLATHYAEFERSLIFLKIVKQNEITCAISGAVGTFAHVDPRIEQFVAKELNLKRETISTQIIPRDRHARIISSISFIASAIERIAIEIRHLQRTEVAEVEESFSKGQKGSSAMPHKRNPVLSENLTGIARLVRSYSSPMMENISLWHERDISHSSVERVILPDCFVIIDFALHRLAKMLKNLLVKPEKMIQNIHIHGGIINSQRVLLTLIQKGLDRDTAYKLVQRITHSALGFSKSFKQLLKQDNQALKYLNKDDIEELFDLRYHIHHVDNILSRVFFDKSYS